MIAHFIPGEHHVLRHILEKLLPGQWIRLPVREISTIFAEWEDVLEVKIRHQDFTFEPEEVGTVFVLLNNFILYSHLSSARYAALCSLEQESTLRCPVLISEGRV